MQNVVQNRLQHLNLDQSDYEIMGYLNEIIVIAVIAAILIFGVKKIPELARTFGKAKGEFEKGKLEAEKELKDFKDKEDLK